MARPIRLALAAALLAGTSPMAAHAATYVWSSGVYVPGVTSPNPLQSGDVLSIQTSAGKTFGANFTNASGRVDWLDGHLSLGDAFVGNGGLWNIGSDGQLSGGTSGTFFNSGIFRKSGGTGTTKIIARFSNFGRIEAATGSILFDSVGVQFNSGTRFLGAGKIRVGGSEGASFNGGISSTNLVLEFGTFTGTEAVLYGQAAFTGGGFVGDWRIDSASTLAVSGITLKSFDGSFTNDGIVNWSQANIQLKGGAKITNNGTWAVTDSSDLVGGGFGERFTNNGLFRKTGAGTTTALNASFTNNGTVDWREGSLSLGTIVGNHAVWDMAAGLSMTSSGSGLFVNNDSGIFRNGGGAGTTTINARFSNFGTIEAAAGDILFDSISATFASGTRFLGAGRVRIGAGGATFNGAISSTNLVLEFGTFTGTAAVLYGQAAYTGGGFTGNWTIDSGSTLAVSGVTAKSIDGSFTNDGTVNWSQASIQLKGGANVTNNGTWAVTDSSDLVGGGFGERFTNNGLFRKTGAGTTTALNASFTNNGTVDWREGSLSLGTIVGNHAVWDMAAGLSMTSSGSGLFVNNDSGIFRNGGGAGTTTINARFSNFGTIEAAAGDILFDSISATFASGTRFLGAGRVRIGAGGATFNGAISSTNLFLEAGTFSGTAAVLSGQATYLGGGFAGEWTLGSNSTLDFAGATAKSIAGSFTNDGAINWSQANIALKGGANVINNGTWVVTDDSDLVAGSGGGTFTNNGLFRKTGPGFTQLATGLVNNGLIDVQDGSITLPNDFVNQGTLAGTGTYILGGTLTNAGVIAPGAGGTGIGTLSLKGGYRQTATGSLDIQFGPAGSFDNFLISGAADLGGSLQLFCASCAFNVGDMFTILEAGVGLTGTFANWSATGFDPGFAYSIIYDQPAAQVRVRIDNLGAPTAAVPEPATWAMLLAGFGAIGGALRRRPRMGVTVP